MASPLGRWLALLAFWFVLAIPSAQDWSHFARREDPRSLYCGDTPHPERPSAMSPCASGPHRSNYGSWPVLGRLRIWLELFGGSAGRCDESAVPSVLAQAPGAPRELEPPPGRENVVVELEIDGPITQQTEELLDAALREADARRAQALLVVLDTPGGRLDSTRSMVRRLLDAPLPVIAYVAPAGARAASAGLFLVLASHVAAMHPASNIGAAHPVGPFGDEIQGSMGSKVLNDTAAWARSLAEARGRNAQWAEQAVRESVSATASEARTNRVVDLLADNASALLASIDGNAVIVREQPWRVTTQGAQRVRVEPTARQALFAALANPVLVYLLLIIGALGLFVEFSNPGLIVPGVVGVLSLGVVFGLQLLPMNGFALLLLGIAALLFVAEVYITSFGLLSAAGLACLALGSYLLFDVPGSSLRLDASVIVATLLGVLLVLVMVGYKLVQIRRQGATSGPERFPGREARVAEVITAGGQGRVFFDGSLWNATSSSALGRDERCIVTAVEGLLLHVVPAAAPSSGPPLSSSTALTAKPRSTKPDPQP